MVDPALRPLVTHEALLALLRSVRDQEETLVATTIATTALIETMEEFEEAIPALHGFSERYEFHRVASEKRSAIVAARRADSERLTKLHAILATLGPPDASSS